MHFQSLGTVVGLLLASTQVYARPLSVERRQGSSNFSISSIITSVPAAFSPNGTNLVNPNASIGCYQGQYIDSGSFTLAVQQACTQYGTLSLSPGQRYWQTMKTFESIPGNPSTNKTLIFAPEDPNHGESAKIDIFVLNSGMDGGASVTGDMQMRPDICISIAAMVIQTCKSEGGNQPGGSFVDGPFTMYLDSGKP
ncbi:hypothetical protein D9757_001814 [Collybiopsis confluens]|uniref:Uncharacterized protein n=1 Tax=Collybiopsis confluens TaxID=2823264 RepID=A0A8H5HYQ6_9AGAR|nr:hypothetical protein D9757_001814 [Collybiopsis confluens]